MATNKRLIKSNDEGGAGLSFNTVLYSGNDSIQSVSGVGFQPDWVWLMGRNIARNYMYSELNGNIEYGVSFSTEGWYDAGNALTSFDSDGFTLGDNFGSNEGGINYVAWCWKAGGAAVTNTDGTITSQVSANTEAGFSIVSYTAPSSGTNSRIGHGLDSAPKVIITKKVNGTSDWYVFNTIIDGSYDFLKLNSTNAKVDDNALYLPTSTTISSQNFISSNWIAYCFAEKAGFSKFGSYVGTGGTLEFSISTGFEPAFVMIKRTDNTGSWRMYDNKRDPSGGSTDWRIDHNLNANLSSAEYDASAEDPYLYFDDNGFNFKTINTNTDVNANGGTYIYMAFANQF